MDQESAIADSRPVRLLLVTLLLLGSSRCTDATPPPSDSAGTMRVQWSKDLGELYSLFGVLAASDAPAARDSVLVGSFNGTIDLGRGPLMSNATLRGLSTDLLLCRYDPDGKLLWSRHFGRRLGFISPLSAAVAHNGDIVVGGFFKGTIDLGGSPLMSNDNGGDTMDAFLARYSADGQHMWSRRFGGTWESHIYNVAIGRDGGIFVAGSFSGTADFGSGPLTSVGDGIVVAKYDAEGELLWLRHLGADVAAPDHAVLQANAGGELLIAGAFGGTLDLGGGALTSQGEQDAFLATYTGDGDLAWAKRFGPEGKQSIARMALDNKGNIVLQGSFTASFDLGSGKVLTTPDGSSGFLAKYTPAGEYLWSSQLTQPSSVSGLAVDGSGNILLLGNMPSADGPDNSPISRDLAVAKYNPAGALLWSQRFNVNSDYIDDHLALDGGGSPLLTGHFQSFADFGEPPLTATGNEHTFLVKLRP